MVWDKHIYTFLLYIFGESVHVNIMGNTPPTGNRSSSKHTRPENDPYTREDALKDLEKIRERVDNKRDILKIKSRALRKKEADRFVEEGWTRQGTVYDFFTSFFGDGNETHQQYTLLFEEILKEFYREFPTCFQNASLSVTQYSHVGTVRVSWKNCSNKKHIFADFHFFDNTGRSYLERKANTSFVCTLPEIGDIKNKNNRNKLMECIELLHSIMAGQRNPPLFVALSPNDVDRNKEIANQRVQEEELQQMMPRDIKITDSVLTVMQDNFQKIEEEEILTTGWLFRYPVTYFKIYSDGVLQMFYDQFPNCKTLYVRQQPSGRVRVHPLDPRGRSIDDIYVYMKHKDLVLWADYFSTDPNFEGRLYLPNIEGKSHDQLADYVALLRGIVSGMRPNCVYISCEEELGEKPCDTNLRKLRGELKGSTYQSGLLRICDDRVLKRFYDLYPNCRTLHVRQQPGDIVRVQPLCNVDNRIYIDFRMYNVLPTGIDKGVHEGALFVFSADGNNTTDEYIELLNAIMVDMPRPRGLYVEFIRDKEKIQTELRKHNFTHLVRSRHMDPNLVRSRHMDRVYFMFKPKSSMQPVAAQPSNASTEQDSIPPPSFKF